MKKCGHCLGTGREQNHAYLGRWMRRRRIGAGVTQAALAGRLGIAAAYLCKLEKGERAWDLDLFERVGRALKKSCKKNLRRRSNGGKSCKS